MITLDGTIGNGTVWVSWKPSTQNTTSVIPSWIGAYVGISPTYSPVLPCAMFLPKPSGELLYHTGFTPYGGRVQTIEVGTLIDTCGDHHYPNPCTHSTITGTVVPLAANSNDFARHRIQLSDHTWDGVYYDLSSKPLSMMGGAPARSSDCRTLNHAGELVDIPLSGETSWYWYNDYLLLMSHVADDYSSPAYPNKHAEHGQWMCSINPPSVVDSQPHLYHFSTWTHSSNNVWTEEYWSEYHQNQSYIPKLPNGWSGIPYVVAMIHVRRVHTLRYLKCPINGIFLGYFDITEDIEYYGSAEKWGATKSSYANVVHLEVLLPGLVSDQIPHVEGLDTYCINAGNRARILYLEKEMGIARSNAISEVSALESNWLENFSQVGGYADIFDPLVDGMASVKANDYVNATRALASAYLVYKYSIAPTIADVGDLDRNVESQISYSLKPVFSNERRRGRYLRTLTTPDRLIDLSYFCTYHLQLKDNSFALILNALERLGLSLSASNGWDFIPFSFVVDWFLSVGPALSKISAYNTARLSRELKARIQTFKVVWSLSSTEISECLPRGWKVAGPLLYSWYDRRVAKRWGTFDPFAGQTNDGLSWSQMTQGSALLLSALL